MHFQVLYFTFTFAISSWMPKAVLGAPVDANAFQPREAPVAGKLVTGGVATFFLQGGAAGACGQKHSDTDLIAAMSSKGTFSQDLCGKQVKVTNTKNKKTVTATIADECPGCKNAQSIDLSQGAFDKIGTEAEGELDIEWTLQ